MTAVFNTTTILPSIKTSTFRGENCSELFILNASGSVNLGDIEDLSEATPDANGDIYRVHSSGWSKMLVWVMINKTAFRIVNSTPEPTAVFGLRDQYNSLPYHPLTTDNISTSDVRVVVKNAGWFPCPVLSSSQINPGTDSNLSTPPPHGTHQVGNRFTFSSNPRGAGGFNHNWDASVEFSDAADHDTYVLGPAIIDVSGTKEIFLSSQALISVETAKYYIGQFIS